MFVVGLLVGPALGLVTGDGIAKSRDSRWWWLAALVLFLFFVLFAPWFALELKLGLIFGALLGLLLAATPVRLYEPGDAESPEWW